MLLLLMLHLGKAFLAISNASSPLAPGEVANNSIGFLEKLCH
jgi:hypothetical protein